MIKVKKRNHYLPRFYLKGFCDSNSRVWMYDKINPEQFAKSFSSARKQRHSSASIISVIL
ncbi:MAG: DUF4238 domain-containing protein [Gammaproteobacteria bacterium]|nr:DUF4238 domain-containing protein [Gammaproteobacteria bacterium]